MRIELSKDWDSTIQPPNMKGKSTGHFAGRRREVELLVNDILNREQGSVLISGYRGVGKTTMVYKALDEVKQRDPNVIAILLNAAQLEAESENPSKIDPENIIENLIRRLYSTVKDMESVNVNLRKKVGALYRKAVSREFKLKERLERQAEIVAQQVDEQGIDFRVSESNIKTAFLLLCWFVAAILQAFPATSIEWFNRVIPLVLAIPIPFGFNYFYKTTKSKSIKEEVKGSAEELYEFDNSIGNLEFDLEEIHKEFYNLRLKPIYVIDELDKIEKIDSVFQVLKFFKNLFTLSKAIFFFIGGEELYPKPLAPGQQRFTRAKEYTYFSSRYFLQRPVVADLNEFMNKVIVTSTSNDDIAADFLKRSILFDARNDYFDLLMVIRDRITGFSKAGNPIIDMEEISAEDVQKARFHKAVTVLYEQKYAAFKPSKWYENEMVTKKLFEHSHMLCEKRTLIQIADEETDSLEASAVRDLNRFLHRLGALNILSERDNNIGGLQVKLGTYGYTGGIPDDPPDSLNQHSEVERRLLEAFQRFGAFIQAVNNLHRSINGQQSIDNETFWQNPSGYVHLINDLGFDAQTQFNAHKNLYSKISFMKPPEPYRREVIEEATTQIRSQTGAMLTSLPSILSKIVLMAHSDIKVQVQQLSQNNNLFGGSASKIRDSVQKHVHFVAFTPDFSKQILFCRDEQDLLNAIRNVEKVIHDNSTTHAVVLTSTGDQPMKGKGIYVVSAGSPGALVSTGGKVLTKLHDFLLT